MRYFRFGKPGIIASTSAARGSTQFIVELIGIPKLAGREVEFHGFWEGTKGRFYPLGPG